MAAPSSSVSSFLGSPWAPYSHFTSSLSSLPTTRKGYSVARANSINLEDARHRSGFPSLYMCQKRGPVPNPAAQRYDRTELKAIPKQYFNTTRIRGRYDGPNDDPANEPYGARKSSVITSTLPSRRPITSIFRRPSLKVFESNSSTKSTNSAKSPDRFLPRRPAFGSAAQCFRVNKDPQNLSTNEKLLRNGEASPDAFNPRRRASSPIPSTIRPVSRRDFTAHRYGGGASVLTFQRDPASANGDRHVSVGTVWTVGGLAPMNAGVPDGRGGLLISGTNTPLYTTPFSIARPKAHEEMEKHEGRLAEALELDRATRVLEFRGRSISRQKQAITTKNKDKKLDSKTIWQGTEWIMGGPDPKTLASPEVCAVLEPQFYPQRGLLLTRALRSAIFPLPLSKSSMPQTFVTTFIALFWHTLRHATRLLLVLALSSMRGRRWQVYTSFITGRPVGLG